MLDLATPRIMVAAGVGFAGFFTSVVGSIVAATGDPSAIVPWAQVGGSIGALGALSYIAKLMADGRLVARDPARVEAQLVELVRQQETQIIDGKKREDWLQHLIEERLK